MIDKSICDKRFIWNPRNCEYECEKSYDVGEYLDYENCKCWKLLVDKLVEECSENINDNILISVTLNYYKNVYGSCTICIVLLVIFHIYLIRISCIFVYFYWYLKKDHGNITNINANTKTITYWTYKWQLSNELV